MNFNIYVPSYHRWQETEVFKRLEYCTYVVRESEYEKYKGVGIENVLPVEDDKINSFIKVHTWLIENTPEDIICVLDDDISRWYYRLSRKQELKDPEIITMELERLAQILYDLRLGLLGSPITAIPYYHEEYKLSGTIGPIRIYNKKFLKARYVEMPFYTDTDYVLQELLYNRVVLKPEYFCTDAKLETNKGGMNTSRHKRNQNEAFRAMKEKWGKYVHYSPKTNVTKITVKR